MGDKRGDGGGNVYLVDNNSCDVSSSMYTNSNDSLGLRPDLTCTVQNKK